MMGSSLELMYRVERGDRCSLHDLLSPTYLTKPLETMEKVKAGTEFTVYAKTLTGKAATIQVTGEDTIDEVKAKIEESYFDLLQTDLKVKSKQGQIQDFFRRGCTRLLLYFNTNKPHSFFFSFLQNTSCIRKP